VPPAASPARPQVRHITGWRRLLALPLAIVVRLWTMSLRFSMDEETAAALGRRSEPLAFVLWHNRLFLVAEIARRFRKGRPVYGLVSASKDGAWLEAFFEMMGIKAVRGSSSKLGREAASALVEVLRAGNDIGITPDGPRGPCYEFKGGALIVARRAHCTMLLLGARYSSYVSLRSWDRFQLPLPFAKVHLRAVLVPAGASTEERASQVERLGALLRELNPDRA
jgi:lysophospholipid acyltransferase (LPLAT)-like uncharacterized protein